MKDPEITVLRVEPGKAPEPVTMPNTLEAMQQMVGGYIEVVCLDDACLICNEEGKLIGLDGNRRVGDDIITGTFFIAGDTRRSLLPHPGAAGAFLPAVCPAGNLPTRRGGGFAPLLLLLHVRCMQWKRSN